MKKEIQVKPCRGDRRVRPSECRQVNLPFVLWLLFFQSVLALPAGRKNPTQCVMTVREEVTWHISNRSIWRVPGIPTSPSLHLILWHLCPPENRSSHIWGNSSYETAINRSVNSNRRRILLCVPTFGPCRPFGPGFPGNPASPGAPRGPCGRIDQSKISIVTCWSSSEFGVSGSRRRSWGWVSLSFCGILHGHREVSSLQH